MKTKVRIIRTESSQYQHLQLQFLHQRWAGCDELEVAFTITYQSGGTYNDKPIEEWYGFHFIIDTDRLENAEYALKILRYIDKNIDYEDKENPEKLLKALGAELYVFNDKFLPVSLNGCNVYKVYKNNEWYASVYAFNEDEANIEVRKKYIDKYSFDTMWIIELYKKNIELISSNCNIEKK